MGRREAPFRGSMIGEKTGLTKAISNSKAYQMGQEQMGIEVERDFPDEGDKFDFAAAVTVYEDYNQANARIGDGTQFSDRERGRRITVQSTIEDNPSIQAQSMAKDDTKATKRPQTKAGAAFAVDCRCHSRRRIRLHFRKHRGERGRRPYGGRRIARTR